MAGVSRTRDQATHEDKGFYRLAPLVAFDPQAFVESNGISSELCDFVLALALAYNDYRDVLVAHALLSNSHDETKSTPPQERALYGGVRATLTRMLAGVVNELLALIEVNASVVADPFFQEIVRKLSRKGRGAWAALHDVALGRQSGHGLAKVLLLIRHKVAFHYDAEQLGVGYRRAFVRDMTHGEPLLSKGYALVQTRFCFADAAAQSFVNQRAQDPAAQEFLHGTSDLITQMHLALYEVVTRFIQARGFGWQRPAIEGMDAS